MGLVHHERDYINHLYAWAGLHTGAPVEHALRDMYLPLGALLFYTVICRLGVALVPYDI